MGFWNNLFGRGSKKGDTGAPPPPSGGGLQIDVPSPDLIKLYAGEGGAHPLVLDLDRELWAAQSEATTAARRDIVLTWPDGQIAIEEERAIALKHQQLRSRLFNYVTSQIREAARPLYDASSRVASVYDQLKYVDADLVDADKAYQSAYSVIRDDPIELPRYLAVHRDARAAAARHALAALFVISEFVISGYIFDQYIKSPLIPHAGWIFAIGLTLLLIVAPHYAAHHLKEGLTHYHQFRGRKKRPNGVEAQQLHFEKVDDRYYARVSWIFLAVIGLLVVPLSIIRAQDAGSGSFLWFAVFVLMQYGISIYFFAMEWATYGVLSTKLGSLATEREQLRKHRTFLHEKLETAIAAYHKHADDVIFIIENAPQWDNYIVTSSAAAIRQFRSIIVKEQSELAVFVHNARFPTLPTAGVANDLDDIAGHGTPLADGGEGDSDFNPESIVSEVPSLNRDDLFGATWFYEELGRALTAPGGRPGVEHNDVEDETADRFAILLAKSPYRFLDHYLFQFFGLESVYSRPKEQSAATNEPESHGADASAEGSSNVGDVSEGDDDLSDVQAVDSVKEEAEVRDVEEDSSVYPLSGRGGLR